MFLLIVLLILACIYGYSGWRVISAFDLSHTWNLIASLVVLLMALLAPGMIFVRSRLPRGRSTDLLVWTTYLQLGYMTLTFGLLLTRDLFWALLAGIHWAASAGAQTAMAAEIPAPPDFDLLISTNLGVLILALALTGRGIYQARRRPPVRCVSVPIENLPSALDGLTITQISDLHVGLTIKRAHVEAVVEQVLSIDADLIVFTGDLADGSVEQLRHDVSPLRALSAPLGTFFVTGNHEYYAGVEQWVQEAENLGFQVLLNQHQPIEIGDATVILAGVTDYGAEEMVKGPRLGSEISAPGSSTRRSSDPPRPPTQVDRGRRGSRVRSPVVRTHAWRTVSAMEVPDPGHVLK